MTVRRFEYAEIISAADPVPLPKPRSIRDTIVSRSRKKQELAEEGETSE